MKKALEEGAIQEAEAAFRKARELTEEIETWIEEKNFQP